MNMLTKSILARTLAVGMVIVEVVILIIIHPPMANMIIFESGVVYLPQFASATVAVLSLYIFNLFWTEGFINILEFKTPQSFKRDARKFKWGSLFKRKR